MEESFGRSFEVASDALQRAKSSGNGALQPTEAQKLGTNARLTAILNRASLQDFGITSGESSIISGKLEECWDSEKVLGYMADPKNRATIIGDYENTLRVVEGCGMHYDFG